MNRLYYHMRILIVFCHPSQESFAAHTLAAVTDTLIRQGHECVIRDLYADRFDPVLTAEEWSSYEQMADRDAALRRYVDDLASCQGIVLIFPTWWYGMPALMKGYLDRIWVPGVAFRFGPHRKIEAAILGHIKRFVVVTTYGSPWWWVKLWLRDPVRMAILRGLRPLISPKCRTLWFALYGMDTNSERARTAFIARVTKAMETLAD